MGAGGGGLVLGEYFFYLVGGFVVGYGRQLVMGRILLIMWTSDDLS